MAYWNWDEEDVKFAEELLGERSPDPAPEVISSPIEVTITKEKAESIVGAGNVQRYWVESIPSVAESVLASGSNQWPTIYQELEEAGWKGRSVSIVKDLVDHYRLQPLAPAADEQAALPPVMANPSLLRPGALDGRIGVLSDKSGEAVALTIRFPYDDHFLGVIRRMSGRRWNSGQKRWEVPIEYAEKVFENFKHFELSEKAAALKNA